MKASILKALKKVISTRFSKDCLKVKNPYDGGFVSKKIVAILKKELPKVRTLKKRFYDYV